MGVTLVQISPEMYHGVVNHITVYVILKSTVWGDRWRAFTHPHRVFITDTDTLEEMKKYLDKEQLV